MCTVTVVRDRHEVRLACNRDEQRSRAAALPPDVRRFGGRQAVLPIDPHSGGTWIAANDAGLALTLLNVNEGPPQRSNSRSRGAIIPELMFCDTLTAAVSQSLTFDAATYAPFRLVMADRDEVAELRADGQRIQLVRRAVIAEPLLFTSSRLGDALVEGPRQRLFEAMVGSASAGRAGQDAFHRHHWPESPHLSVCMRRADARTVSYTVVTLTADAVRLDYHPDAPDTPAETRSLVLAPRAGGVPCLP